MVEQNRSAKMPVSPLLLPRLGSKGMPRSLFLERQQARTMGSDARAREKYRNALFEREAGLFRPPSFPARRPKLRHLCSSRRLRSLILIDVGHDRRPLSSLEAQRSSRDTRPVQVRQYVGRAGKCHVSDFEDRVCRRGGRSKQL